jgi:hypothetical protein
MSSYILKAINPSKLSSEKFVYYTGDAWDTNMEKVIYYLDTKSAEEALKLTYNAALEIEIAEITEGGPKVNAEDGDGDGLVEDGTKFERPVQAETVKKKPAGRPRRKKSI